MRVRIAKCLMLLTLTASVQVSATAPAVAEVNQSGAGECVPLQWVPLWGTRANGEACLLGGEGGGGTASDGEEGGSGGVIDDGRDEPIVIDEVIPCKKQEDCLPGDRSQGVDRPLGFEKGKQPPSGPRRPVPIDPPKKKPPSAAVCRKIKAKLQVAFKKQFPRLDLEYVVAYVRDLERDPRLRSPWLDGPAKLVGPALKQWDGKGCDAALDWRKA